jgi:serpin B
MSGSRMALILVGLLVGTSETWAQEEAEPKAEPGPTAAQEGDQTGLVAGNTRFAIELYNQLRKEDGNLFFSPFSLSTALAMTYAGARGNTAAEMAQVLHFELAPERLHPAFAKLQQRLDVSEDEDAGYRLHVANALWPQEGYAFLPEFFELCQTHYRAGLQSVDYARATEEARQTINRWVEQRTENKIKELLKPGILTRLTTLVLTNAIYFKGDWAAQFDKDKTHDAPFTRLDGKQVSIPLMNQTGEFGYLEDADIQVLELPYAGEALSMVVLLPRKPQGLPALEESLSARKLADWLSKLRPRTVRVALPRFKMTSEFQLNDVLQALGMRDAFIAGRADFSGMTGSRGLFIGAVVHQAFVDVNEEGTEAAAATAVVMLKGGLPPAFRADHPFLFLIRDVRTGSILFFGRVMDPAG